MGRDWYNWPARGQREPTTERSCISGMLHLLDFHHLIFAANGGGRAAQMKSSPPAHTSFKSPPQLTGVEAPRNSLELDERAASSSSAIGDDFYDIPLGIQLPPSTPSSAGSEEPRSSQAGTPRTPNVIARLMGLEILPDSSSSRTPPLPLTIENEKKKIKKRMDEDHIVLPLRHPLKPRNGNVDTRSLPETPRASSVKREADPRLSLQLGKENRSATQEFSYLCEVYSSESPSPRLTKSNRKDMRLKAHYQAQEIVKQVKESVASRKLGGRSNDEHVVNLKTRIPERKAATSNQISKPSEMKPPIVRFLESAKSYRMTAAEKKTRIKHPPKAIKKPSCEPKKFKKRPTPPATVAIQKKQNSRPDERHSSPISSWQVPIAIPRPVQQERKKTASQNGHRRRPPEQHDAEFRYVRSILEHAGLMTKDSRSMNLPLKPSIFHHLELEIHVLHSRSYFEDDLGLVRHRCNRRLLFHLVDEILSDLFDQNRCIGGGELILQHISTLISTYPAADCRVIGDIDALVERDLPEEKVRGLLRHSAVVAEVENVAIQFEQNIIDSLIEEAAELLAVIHCYRSRNGAECRKLGRGR